jgi:hypothetical protein
MDFTSPNLGCREQGASIPTWIYRVGRRECRVLVFADPAVLTPLAWLAVTIIFALIEAHAVFARCSARAISVAVALEGAHSVATVLRVAANALGGALAIVAAFAADPRTTTGAEYRRRK